jgi:hypothetical protein
MINLRSRSFLQGWILIESRRPRADAHGYILPPLRGWQGLLLAVGLFVLSYLPAISTSVAWTGWAIVSR